MRINRHHPNKPQNNYGGDYRCRNYDKTSNGKEFCHDEGNTGWTENVTWCQRDEDGKLKCKGNRHNCMKHKQRLIASQK